MLHRKASKNHQNLSEEQKKHATMPTIDTENFLQEMNLGKKKKQKVQINTQSI